MNIRALSDQTCLTFGLFPKTYSFPTLSFQAIVIPSFPLMHTRTLESFLTSLLFAHHIPPIGSLVGSPLRRYPDSHPSHHFHIQHPGPGSCQLSPGSFPSLPACTYASHSPSSVEQRSSWSHPVNTSHIPSPLAQNPAVARSEFKGQMWISFRPRAHCCQDSLQLFSSPSHFTPAVLALFALLVPV